MGVQSLQHLLSQKANNFDNFDEPPIMSAAFCELCGAGPFAGARGIGVHLKKCPGMQDVLLGEEVKRQRLNSQGTAAVAKSTESEIPTDNFSLLLTIIHSLSAKIDEVLSILRDSVRPEGVSSPKM